MVISKTIYSWRLEGVVNNISYLLKRFKYVIVQHTRRVGNGVENYLANIGFSS